MTKQKIVSVSIGTGKLTWNRGERVSDRYGYVYLLLHGDSLSRAVTEAPLHYNASDLGQRAEIRAHVLETRQSTHIGDLFRGISPTTPERGETIILGTGLLSVIDDLGPRIGLVPFDDDRQADWLDIKALYRCHEQTVELSYQIVEPPGPHRRIIRVSRSAART